MQPAPADDIIVVSEIGEMWSPHTTPERQAEIPMKNRGSPISNMDATSGIRIPNVPQDVPVAKARKIATTKITTGKNELRFIAALSPCFQHRLETPKGRLKCF